MKQTHLILESAILIALGTGILYSLGHYYDYRIRFEFEIDTIPLGVSPEILIHDGATVLIGWFGSTKEFWVAVFLLAAMGILIVLLIRTFRSIDRRNLVLVLSIISLIVLYSSVVKYIPSRAHIIAEAIERLAALKRQTLILQNDETIEGYTIIGTPLKVAFLTSDNRVLVVEYADIKRIVAARYKASAQSEPISFVSDPWPNLGRTYATH